MNLNGYGDQKPGLGDIASDPKWMNPALGNFNLRSTSACIDAGIAVASPFPMFSDDTNPDMGAIESGKP